MLPFSSNVILNLFVTLSFGSSLSFFSVQKLSQRTDAVRNLVIHL